MISFDEKRAWHMLEKFALRGNRPPGTPEHAEAAEYLFSLMQEFCQEAWLQEFTLRFRGNEIDCANICGMIHGKDISSTILIGSHYDTRWIADNETDPVLINQPIPGVNDGTSGVVIILELARILKEKIPEKNIIFVLFDVEDIGHIDGFEFSVGADYYAKHGRIKPDFVIALDMVGGKNMHLNIDMNSLSYQVSQYVFNTLFKIGRELDYPCFFENKVSAIISDHYPFLRQNIPAVLLIDIDYPQWHTHSDTIENCSIDSLKSIGDVLFRFFTTPYL